ncbi:MAG: hypothetical protein QOF73_2923 [Thermomicrobiales bacterium]|nr:hypothetical protein [Thermomicrobiales bacterium]
MLTRLITVLLVLMIVGAPASRAGAAEDELPQIGIAPVGSDGAFFTLELEPGTTRELKVALSNYGTKPVSARTYAADVYTILNGGFGAKLADEPATGVTKWLDYEADVLRLDPSTTVERDFTVTVPEKAKPGEYITSLVIENADPIKGSGSIALNQVIRQVIAVAITVPGPQKPQLEITEATYEVLPSYARILVGLDNTGNVRLKPAGEVVLVDSAGAELKRAPVTMDSFYAGTETAIEVILAEPLEAGEFTVSVTLKDEEHELKVEEKALPLTVENVDASGSPVAEVPTVVIESVGVNELRDQSTNALQGVELVVGVDNPALPITNGRLTLHVSRDGEKVEDYVLGSSLSFPGGKEEFRQRYLPMTGWTPGIWSFSVTLDVVDPNTGTVTELATAEAENTVTVS